MTGRLCLIFTDSSSAPEIFILVGILRYVLQHIFVDGQVCVCCWLGGQRLSSRAWRVGRRAGGNNMFYNIWQRRYITRKPAQGFKLEQGQGAVGWCVQVTGARRHCTQAGSDQWHTGRGPSKLEVGGIMIICRGISLFSKKKSSNFKIRVSTIDKKNIVHDSVAGPAGLYQWVVRVFFYLIKLIFNRFTTVLALPTWTSVNLQFEVNWIVRNIRIRYLSWHSDNFSASEHTSART